MAITRFNPNTGLTAGTGTAAQNVALALTRLRDRNIVNKFNGASIAENLPTGITAARNIAISTDITISTAGYYVFVNRTVEFESGGSLRATVDGVHVAFFNCNLIFKGQNNNAGNQNQLCITNVGGSLHNAGHDVSISQAQASSRSINLYGCSYQVDPGATGAFYWLQGDVFDTSFIFSDDGIFLPSSFIGTRLINQTTFGRRGALDIIELYGIPEIVEGAVNDAVAWEFVTTVTFIDFMQIAPSFTDSTAFEGTQQQRFRINANDSSATFKNIGFHAPVDNTLAKAFGTADQGNFYVRGSQNTSGGVILMYGWKPEFYEDGGATGIAGVRVRVANGITIDSGATVNDNFNTAGESSANYSQQNNAITSRAGGIDQTGNVKNIVHEYLSVAGTATDDFRGKLRLQDGLVRVSIDGGATWHENNHINWGRIRNENTGAAGVDAFYTNFNNQTSSGAGDNVIATPLIYISQNQFNQYEASYEARSYTHQVNVAEELQNGIVSADGNGATQVADTLVPVADRVVFGAQPRPNIVAATEEAAINRFGTIDNRTPQQINDLIIAAWARYADRGSLVLPVIDGNNARFTQSLLFSPTPNSNAIDNVVATPTTLTIGSISALEASAATDPVTGFTTTGTITFGSGIDSDGVTYNGADITFDPDSSYGGNFTATTNIEASGASFLSNAVLSAGDTITGDATTTFADGVVIDGGDLSGIQLEQLNGITLNGNRTLETNETGVVTLANVSVTGTITVNKISADLIIRVPQAQIDAGNWAEGVGNISIEAIPPARPMYTVAVDEVRAGFLYIYDATGDNIVVDRVLTGTETDTTFTLDGNTYADDNQFYGVFWPDSTLENPLDDTPQSVYLPNPITWDFSEGNQVLSATAIAAVLEDEATGVLSGQTFTTANTGSGPNTQTTISISGANMAAATGAQSLSESILIHNDPDLRRTFVNRQETIPYLSIGLNNSTQWRDFGAGVTYANAPFRFQSGDTQTVTLPNASGVGSTSVTAPAVQTFSNWNNQIVRTDRGVTEVASIPEGSLTSQQAQLSLGAVIDRADLPSRAQIRQDLSNQSNTGQVFNSDGTVVLPDTTPAD